MPTTTTTTQRWLIGDVRISAVVESQIDGIPPELFFPGADAALVTAHPWLVPHYADEQGNIGMRVQAFVVEAGGRLLVIDPCVGNGKQRALPSFNDLATPFLERFTDAGFDPDRVDVVVHTHLHVDHVGWDTQLVDGRWVPTFPNARYVYVQPELDWFRGRDAEAVPEVAWIEADTLTPVFDAGLADLVAPDADLGDGLRLQPTPGHTPGHVSLWIESGSATALVTGDVLHHPVQCAEPTVGFVADGEPAQAVATRLRLLHEAAERHALVLGTHFPTLPAGTVRAEGTAWRFEPDLGEDGG